MCGEHDGECLCFRKRFDEGGRVVEPPGSMSVFENFSRLMAFDYCCMLRSIVSKKQCYLEITV